jgi:hypothetical protein
VLLISWNVTCCVSEEGSPGLGGVSFEDDPVAHAFKRHQAPKSANSKGNAHVGLTILAFSGARERERSDRRARPTATPVSLPDGSMSNASYICFDCRQAVRRSTPERDAVRCSSCGRRCQYLGRKIPVPPKTKVAAWRALRASMATIRVNWALRQERDALKRRHTVEKRIVELEAKPSNASRDHLLNKLRRELDAG